MQILQDNAFEKQTKDSFQMVANPKATATVILDELSRTMCPYLKNFVVFSSITCGYGNPGQSNYGYANSVMERICQRRRQEGLPGLAIEWAGVADVGYLESVKNSKVPGKSKHYLRYLQIFQNERNQKICHYCSNKVVCKLVLLRVLKLI